MFTMPFKQLRMAINNDQDMPERVTLTGVDDPNGRGEYRVSIRLAMFVQLLVMASGIGGTYAAVRAGIDSDRQHIEQLLDSNRTLNLSIQEAQRSNILLGARLDTLANTIDFLSKELTSIQERLWNDRRRSQQ